MSDGFTSRPRREERDADADARDRANLIDELDRLRRSLDRIVAAGESAFLDPDDETRYLAAEAILIHFDDAATRRVPVAIKEELFEVPWRNISGMRNILAHDYRVSRKPIVWQVVSVELPAVLDTISTRLRT